MGCGARRVERCQGAARGVTELLRSGLDLERRGNLSRRDRKRHVLRSPHLRGRPAHRAPTAVSPTISRRGSACRFRRKASCAARATRWRARCGRQVKNRVDLVKISGDSQAQERMPDAVRASPTTRWSSSSTRAPLGRKSTIHSRYAETVAGRRARRRRLADPRLLHAREDVGSSATAARPSARRSPSRRTSSSTGGTSASIPTISRPSDASSMRSSTFTAERIGREYR